MDKIFDLLKNHGSLGLLLAIIAITDIPKSFFGALIKWFFERKNKPYWSSQPSRSFIVFPIIGIIGYQRTKLIRQNFFKELIEEKKSKISQLYKEIVNRPAGK